MYCTMYSIIFLLWFISLSYKTHKSQVAGTTTRTTINTTKTSKRVNMVVRGTTIFDDSPPPRLVLEKRIQINNNKSETNIVILHNATHTGYNGYVAKSSSGDFLITTAFHHHCSSHGGGVETTSKQAKHNSCQVATNGGPFESYRHGGCTGLVILNGTIVSGNFSSSSSSTSSSSSSLASGVGFGVTSDGNWLLGQLASESQVQQLGVDYFVTGLNGWLVYNGSNVVSSSKEDSSTSTAAAGPNIKELQSARTAVGVDYEGRLILVVVDGCEKCWERKHRGSTLQELASLLIRLGVKHSINLDGGGSSTFVYKKRPINKPTCLDIPYPVCERPVTTVMCIK